MSDIAQLMERVRFLEATLPPENVDVPYVGGQAEVGGTLTCTSGNWNCMSNGTYAYAWSGSGEATENSYVVAAGDAGTSITCTVTGTNPNGAVAAPPSNAVAIAAAAGEMAAPAAVPAPVTPPPVQSGQMAPPSPPPAPPKTESRNSR